jgi:FtsH-binding integral membrane protein
MTWLCWMLCVRVISSLSACWMLCFAPEADRLIDILSLDHRVISLLLLFSLERNPKRCDSSVSCIGVSLYSFHNGISISVVLFLYPIRATFQSIAVAVWSYLIPQPIRTESLLILSHWVVIFPFYSTSVRSLAFLVPLPPD